jgi:DNA polymerase-3 subunit delta'
MVKLMAGLPRLDVAAIHGFAERAAKGDEAFRTTTLMFCRGLARAAARPSQGDGEAEVVAGEGDLQRRLTGMVKLDRLVEVWEKTNHLFDRADAVNLDRKQVVMNAFFALEQSCRS